MRRLKVAYRPEAREDLKNIYFSVLRASQNKTTALRFYERIRDRCERIGLVPFGGRPRNDLGHGLRMAPFEHSAVIIYKVEAHCVRIANVFYGGQDYETFYLGTSTEDEDHESNE